jgi:glucosamine kinase
LSDHEQLVLAANAIPPPDFAGLFPVVLAAAESGDAIAGAVLTQAGTELAGLAGIVVHQIFQEDKAIPVAMSGGVFANSILVREIFHNRLHSGYSGTAWNPTVVEPVRGALALARRGAR